ncbi:hypothetical protein ACFV9E_03635 [Streptomyces sp. NPDC059835]|uniref:hypothetical protein n=1 Tax=unclassified Streptomyces TaxID=2593676 RepID=UPI0036567F0B
MPLSLAEFKRRAMQCTDFKVENHRFPHRSGPRAVIRINSSGVRAIRPDTANEETFTAWPYARLCRIEDNRITFLHDGNGSDCFTLVFPFTV